MTRSIVLSAAFGGALAAVLVATAAPAFAVSIRHTNRAEGDPEAAAAPRSAAHVAPPADTSGQRYFDKLHQDGARG